MHSRILIGIFSALSVTSVSSTSLAQNVTSPTNEQQADSVSNPLPFVSSNWTARENNGEFSETGIAGQQQIAMVLLKNSKHFEIFLSGYTADIPSDTNVAFHVTFDNGTSFSFSGLSTATNIQANINDEQVASWTHNLTADQTMTVTFDSISQSSWVFTLSGTTPTVTALAEGLTLAGIDGLPGPWKKSANNSSSIGSQALPTQSTVTPSNDTDANVPDNNASPNQSSLPTESKIPTFSDPLGIKYANTGETSWTTNTKYNEMTDQNDITVVSEQKNDSGADAEITGSCSNKVISFDALVTDDSGGTSVKLTDATMDSNNVDPSDPMASINFLALNKTIVGAIGEGDVEGQIRVNADHETDTSFRLIDYSNQFRVVLLSIEQPNTYSSGPHFDIRSVWRILAEVNTDHDPIILKIPLYDPQIENFVKNCLTD